MAYLRWWPMTLVVLLSITTSAIAKAPPVRVQARIDLGKEIFTDASLSADGKTSCASCHRPDHAYSDNRHTSRGVFNRTGTRNVPSLLALTSREPLFWDGRRRQLTEAVMDPFFHPSEMGLADESVLLEKLRTAKYLHMFTTAFGSTVSPSPTIGEARQALAAFVRSIPRPTTAFDRFYTTHAPETLSLAARAGYRLFTGKAGCAACHRIAGNPPSFTDDRFHSTGTGLNHVAAQLPELSEKIASSNEDARGIGKEVGTDADISSLGRFVVTHRPADLGSFRTPSLRYVGNTAPYMHDGSVPTLSRAVEQEIYWRGLKSGHPLSLTVAERRELVAFLRALSMPTSEKTPASSTESHK